MNEASNFCTWPCSDPEAFATTAGDPPQPPAVRLGPPYAIPGFPESFQPQCVAQVSFNVNASTYFGENVVIVGSAVTLGEGSADNSAPLSATNYPIWSAVVDLPTDTVVSYQYVRTETDGSYIYETTNRTITTGGCNGTIQVVNDVITSAQGTPAKRGLAKRSSSPSLHNYFAGQGMSKRQASGSELGLSGRDLIDPPYKVWIFPLFSVWQMLTPADTKRRWIYFQLDHLHRYHPLQRLGRVRHAQSLRYNDVRREQGCHVQPSSYCSTLSHYPLYLCWCRT